MTEQRLKLGARGEEAAVRFLRKMGAKIIARNLRSPVGEIDIVARYKKEILFVEVKTRSSDQFGSPAEAVGARKQQQIIRTAQWYLQQGHGKKLQPRFDVISIMMSGGEFDIDYVPDAFQA